MKTILFIFVLFASALGACTMAPEGEPYFFVEIPAAFDPALCEIRTFGPTGPMGSSAWHACGESRFESFLGTPVVINGGQFYQLNPPIYFLRGVVNFDYLKSLCPGIPADFSPEQISEITWEHVETCSPTP